MEKLQQAKDAYAVKYGFKDWKEFWNEFAFSDSFRIAMAVDEVAIEYNRLMSEWVDVKERLPEEYNEFICELKRMNDLYLNSKYGLAERLRDELINKLDDIMKLHISTPPQK